MTQRCKHSRPTCKRTGVFAVLLVLLMASGHFVASSGAFASTRPAGSTGQPFGRSGVATRRDGSLPPPTWSGRRELRASSDEASSAALESVWDGNDADAFSDLSHPGYSRVPDEFTGAGGWVAHRIDPSTRTGVGDSSACWVKEVSGELTRFDYDRYLGRAPRILVLYGSLRPTSFSRRLAHEFARLLEELGCDVRTYDPRGLPVRDPSLENEVKVLELRALSTWSDGQVWVSPEMHGTITGVFKNQIDWLPLNTGSVRPTQGRTCCVAQVNGGSQSFNAVNALRILARWMRMPCCTNQSSVPKAWREFDDAGRMKDSPLRDRVVDVAEEFAKFTAVMTPVADDLVDRYSERKEKAKEGRLLTQEEKERKNVVKEARKG